MSGPTRRCDRPTLTPVAWLAMALWLGAVAGEDLSWRLAGGGTVGGAPAGYVAALITLGVLAAYSRRRTGRWIGLATAALLVSAGLALGVGVSLLCGVSWHARVTGLADAGAREFVGVVTADPREGAFGPGVRVRVTEGPYRGASLSVWLRNGMPVPEYGQRVRFSAIAKRREHDDAGRRAERSGEHATASPWRFEVDGWPPGVTGSLLRWRAGAVARLAIVRGDAGALLRGVVLGDRRALEGSAVAEDFRVLGLSHVVAVSGTHLAVVCGVVLALGTRLRASRRGVLAAVVATAAGYTVLTGMALSAIRSAIMLACGAAGECVGVRRDGLAALCLAVVGIIVVSPWSVFDVGFALSVTAVGGLLLFGDLGIEWVRAAFADRLPRVTSLLGATIVAQASTLPIVVSAFGMLSLAAPLANLVVVPPAEVAICVGLLGAVLGGLWPSAGALVIRGAGALLGGVAASASALASLPGAAVSIGAPGAVGVVLGIVAMAALWALWPGPGSRAAARIALAVLLVGSLVVGIGPRGPSQLQVTVLDVGQGDAILVRDGSRAMLVDAAPDAAAMRQGLARTGVRSLDCVVLTHDHDDHIGGFAGLTGVVRVGWVGLPQTAATGGFSAVRSALPRMTPRGQVTERLLHAGQVWRVGRAEVRVLWPPAEPPEGLKANDTSVVLLVRCGGFSCVLTGDAEDVAQAGMAEAGALGRVSVLKVPHHGSDNGLTQDALGVWRPNDAVISVGVGNDFGHPCPSTITMLRHSGSRIWRTDECGDVRIDVSSGGYRIVTSRRSGSRRACATIGGRCRVVARSGSTGFPADKEYRGSIRSLRPQTGVPDLRQRRALARARPPPPSRHGRSGG